MRLKIILFLCLLMLLPVISVTADDTKELDKLSLFTCSKDQRLFLRVREGQQVGFPMLAFIGHNDSLLLVNNVTVLYNVSTWNFYALEGRYVDVYCRVGTVTILAKLVISQNAARVQEIDEIYGDLTVEQALQKFVPAGVLAAAVGVLTGVYFKRRSGLR